MGAGGRADICANGHVYRWVNNLALDDDARPPSDRRCTICGAKHVAIVHHYGGNVNDCSPPGVRITILEEKELLEPVGQDEKRYGDLVLRTQLFRKRIVTVVDVNTIPTAEQYRAAWKAAGVGP